MLVRVIYNDLQTGKIHDYLLDNLISQGKIIGFFRSGGYVRTDSDPMRGAGGQYAGPDRRRPGTPMPPL